MQSPGLDAEDARVDAATASAELRAWNYARRGQYQQAADVVRRLINDVENLSETDVAWYLQLEASYLYPVDKADALQKQLKAHELNHNVSRPPSGIQYRRMLAKNTTQAFSILQWMARFTDPNGMVADCQSIVQALNFGVRYDEFEKSLHELAGVIGFQSEQAEKKGTGGPDVLWRLTNGRYLIFEAKDEVYPARAQIYKKEAEQIGHSVTWFKEKYANEGFVPVLIHPSIALARDAVLPEGCKIMRSADLQAILDSVSGFVGTLAGKPANQWRPDEVEGLLRAHQLRPADLVERRLGLNANRTS